jgi:hypothetical protein
MKIARGDSNIEQERRKTAGRVRKHRAAPKAMSLAEFKKFAQLSFLKMSADELLEAQVFVENWERPVGSTALSMPEAVSGP